MSINDVGIDRAREAGLPEDDVVGILLEQHTRIRALLDDLELAAGEHRQQAFEELRAVLAVHETAEEMIVRPVTRRVASAVADARNHEEDDASRVLGLLEKLDVNSLEFVARLADFHQAVLDHAACEENEEFPRLRQACDEEQLQKMGRRLRMVEKIAPTHPHPSVPRSPAAQWVASPIASVVDRVRDALK